MENTISVALDEIASRDETQISQGFARIESLLAEVSFSAPSTAGLSEKVKIHELYSSVDMNEFLDTQDNFMFNIASRMVPVLAQLSVNDHHPGLIAEALEIIQGLCLIHYKSRDCFSRESSMKVLIGLLDGPVSTAQIKTSCVNALVAVMVHEIASIRQFEDLGGLKVICTVFKRKETPKDVKLRILEFLFFYLIPETQGNTVRHKGKGKDSGVERKTTEDKQQLLGKYLSNVKNLVRELQFSKPFGEIDVECEPPIILSLVPSIASAPEQSPPTVHSMISAILLYNQKGEILISRLYRDGLRRSIADVFRIQVISNPEAKSPVLTLGSTTFLHIKHENIYVVAVTRANVDAGLVFEFLYKLVSLGASYFNKFDETSIKNNFTLIYELLDEIIDFGFPQYTETDTLKQYITTQGIKSEKIAGDNSSKITSQATGAISWRRPDIKYRKNEVFVDVLEDVNLLLSSSGSILKSDVNGAIQLKSHLSGMPECKFGLNDSLMVNEEDELGDVSAAAGSVTLEDCQFHQCVKLGTFDSNRIISFTPPDGEFELMRYRAVENVNIPFKVIPQVTEIGKLKVEYNITVKANFGTKLYATDVLIKIPTPLNTANTKTTQTSGKVKYDPAENQMVWKIARFTGGNEYTLHAEVDMFATATQKAWSKPPISMTFSLSMFSSSGIVVRYLKIFEKSNYRTIKWVRYVVRAGSYEIRY